MQYEREPYPLTQLGQAIRSLLEPYRPGTGYPGWIELAYAVERRPWLFSVTDETPVDQRLLGRAWAVFALRAGQQVPVPSGWLDGVARYGQLVAPDELAGLRTAGALFPSAGPLATDPGRSYRAAFSNPPHGDRMAEAVLLAYDALTVEALLKDPRPEVGQVAERAAEIRRLAVRVSAASTPPDLRSAPVEMALALGLAAASADARLTGLQARLDQRDVLESHRRVLAPYGLDAAPAVLVIAEDWLRLATFKPIGETGGLFHHAWGLILVTEQVAENAVASCALGGVNAVLLHELVHSNQPNQAGIPRDEFASQIRDGSTELMTRLAVAAAGVEATGVGTGTYDPEVRAVAALIEQATGGVDLPRVAEFARLSERERVERLSADLGGDDAQRREALQSLFLNARGA